MNAIFTNNLDPLISFYKVDEKEICNDLKIDIAIFQKAMAYPYKHNELYKKIEKYVCAKIAEITKRWESQRLQPLSLYKLLISKE